MANIVLVTGAGGVLGRALNRISDRYPDYQFVFARSADADLTDASSCAALFDRTKPNYVINLAALSGGVGLTGVHPARVLRDNILMNLNVLESARVSGVEKTVMTLSSGMYPPDAPLPLVEESIHEGAAHASNYSYSYAKRLVDPLITSYRAEYDMNVIGVIPNGIIGEEDNFSDTDSTVTAALIKRFHASRNDIEPLVVWGDGSPLRELTYAEDMAAAFMWCLENYNDAQVINVGTTEELSIKQIALIIAETMGIDPSRITFDTSKPSGVHRKSTDNTRFIEASNFKFSPTAEAIRRTTQWYVDSIGTEGTVNMKPKTIS
jgi:GDP-L-fucose synthase